MKMRYWVAGLLAAGLGLGLGGCTPATNSPSPTGTPPTATVTTPATPSATATPTPTPTWDANQTAAVAAVRGYFETSATIGANPAGYTKAQMTSLLSGYIGGDMIPANVTAFVKLKSHGWREEGVIVPVWTKASAVVDTRSLQGLDVRVTVCQDQTGVRVVDRSGQPVPSEATDAFNLRQFVVQKRPKTSGWLVYGMQTIPGKCSR